MGVLSVSSTNEGYDTGHPSYSVSVSIPSPGSPAADDWVLVFVQWWGPRETQGTGAPGAGVPTVLGDVAAGLNPMGSGFWLPFDSVSNEHSAGHFVGAVTGADFVGGSLTLTKPTVDGTIDPTEFWVGITTVVVDGPATLRPLRGNGEGGSFSVGIDTGHDVVLFSDHYQDTSVTYSTLGSYTELANRALGASSSLPVPHRLAVLEATSPTTAVTFSSTLGFTIVGQAFTASAPAVRIRRGLGLVRG